MISKKSFLELTEEKQIDALEHLDPNDATDLLQELPKKIRDDLLEKVDKDIQHELVTLLEFDPDSAAGLMSLDYVQADVSMKMEEIAEKVKTHEHRTGRVPIILILDENKLKGYLPIFKLGITNPKEKAEKYIKPIHTIHHGAKAKDVLRIFENDPHGKLAVLNGDKILGIIYSEDILRLVNQQRSHSLDEFAGIRHEETVFDSARSKFLFRYKWLIINLATAFLAAFVVSLFEDTISKTVLLAVYMPIVAGMGGNAGTQTLAVMVRGMALHDLKWGSILNALQNEVIAGFLNGLINGAIVLFIVYFFNHNLLVGIVLAAAMVIN